MNPPRPLRPLPIWMVGLVMAGAVGLALLTAAWGQAEVNVDRPSALRWWPNHAEALSNAAAGSLRTADDVAGLTAAEAQARAALARAPLDAQAMRVLGYAAAAREDQLSASRYMRAAARRSLRDSPTQAWLFADAWVREDYSTAYRAADALLRRRPELGETLYPLLLQQAALDEQARDALGDRLSRNPSWRRVFLRQMAQEAPVSATHAVLAQLRASGRPPVDQEIAAYLNRLLREEAYGSAYVAWVQHLPSDTRQDLTPLYDGGFEGLPGIAPFNWRFPRAAGGSTQIVRRPDGDGNALAARVAGLTGQVLADQMVVLSPGRYRLEGEGRIEGADPERMTWVVQCERGSRLALWTPEAAMDRWAPFRLEFTVPAAGCLAQRIQLRVLEGQTRASTQAWFDTLTLSRLGTGVGHGVSPG